MRSTTTLSLFIFVVILTAFSIVVVWPNAPYRYLPGDFWPHGQGLSLGNFDRAAMRLGLDLKGGTRLVLEANPPPEYEGDLDQALEVARDIIERRVNEFGVSESEITLASGNRIVVQVPGLSQEDTESLIGATASLEFYVYDSSGQLTPATGVINGQVVAMTGQHIKNNTYPSQQGTTFAVNFETTSTGAQLMGQITQKAMDSPDVSGRQLLILLDGQVISQAVVQSVITDVGSITGQGSFTEASNLSKQLNAGALPVPLRTVQSSEVSATLGEDAVKATVVAGEIGLLAIMLFMILYYRLPGLLAAAALVVYTALTLAIFKLWPVTLTLSGIAAFILSLGMAVDANILIFERMKEELRRGRTLNTAIDLGFHRAWSSIRDSNVSTLITCLILYWFGEQFGAATVKGFALTLAVGVLVSMFSAITVTRTFLKMVVGTPLARNGWLFNAVEARHADVQPGRGMINFASKRWYFMTPSFLAMAAAIVILAIPPSLKGGIEFTSGSVFTIQFSNAVEQGELRDFMGELGYPEARVQGSGENAYVIRTRELEGAPALDAPVGPVPPGEIDTIMSALEERYGTVQRTDFQTVSSSVSTEIVRYSIFAVVAAAGAIFAYIWIQFRRVPRPALYSAAAIVALAHDALIVLGLFSLLGKLNDTEVDTTFLTAVLTIIGFSVHDTIVVFDRMREKLQIDPFLKFDEAVSASLTETLGRSLTTSATVALAVLAMLLIGGTTIRDFLLVLFVGLVSGAYSSIGLAAQLLVAWEKGDFGRIFGRGRRTEDSDMAPVESAPQPQP